MTNRSRLTDYLLLVAVPAFFFFWKLSAFGLIGADEPRYAQVAREMLMRHDWITPTLGGTPWLEKPPLYYWQAMLAYRVFGVSDWAARLPSAVDAFLLVIAVYFFLRAFRPGVELDGALMLVTMAGTVGFARAASTDMPLAAMFSISMLAWSAWSENGDKKYLAAFYVFLALAMLAKGPVAPFLAIVVIGTFAALHRSVQTFWRTLWIPGILLFCAVALPWYVLVQLRNPHFFHEFIVEHNLARFGTNLYHHPEPFWYYVPVTLLGWVPWVVFIVFATITTIRRWKNSEGDPPHTFIVIWIAVVIFFFSISRSKLPGYVLPAIPPGALLVAEFVHNRTHWGANLGRSVVFGVHALLLGATLFFALMVQSLILQHHIQWSIAAIPCGVALVIAIVTFVLLSKFGSRALRLATLVPIILALAIALRFGPTPLDETLSARPVANELANFDSHHLPVAVFLVRRETEFGLGFYRNEVIDRYELGQIPVGEHLVVAAQGFEKSIAGETGRGPIYLGNFAPQKLEFFYVPER